MWFCSVIGFLSFSALLLAGQKEASRTSSQVARAAFLEVPKNPLKHRLAALFWAASDFSEEPKPGESREAGKQKTADR
jgi:hypothetical protein